MTAFARTDTGVVSRWWRTVDRLTVAAVGVLICVGVVLAFAASPAAGSRIGLDGFYLVRHHVLMLPPAVAVIFGMSLLSPRGLRRVAVIAFLAFLALTALTPYLGQEIKGATRWLSIGGVSLQPSEFLKPSFAVVAAWMFAAQNAERRIPGNAISILLFGLTLALLLRQPDLGMAGVVTATWFAQFFLAGLSMLWVVALAILGVVGLVGAYFAFPHVSERIDGFMDPKTADSYQIDRSLEAFANGGLTGRGPGEGTVKGMLPDAHADFIFAVAGEEFGLVLCLAIVALFVFILLRGIARLLKEESQFVQLAATGLLVGFGLQALVNMASSLHLMPTKGMTLPFISYGGSSLIAISFGMGMLLALTRKRFGSSEL